MVFWEGYASDESMGTFAPIVVYWLYAGMYQLLPPLRRYRLHTRKEEEERNLVPLSSVVRGVLLQQLVQAIVARVLFLVTGDEGSTGLLYHMPLEPSNHPLEGLLLDTFGGALSFLISGMTARTAVFFFCFAVMKTVDDHSGLWLQGNIFQMFFQNNTAYHDIHHQLQGTKFNYSQPFFSTWDKILGTHMPYRLLIRKEGGFEARPMKD